MVPSSELKAGIITSAAAGACPLFGTDTKTPQSHRSSQWALPAAQWRVDLYLAGAAVFPADGSISVLIYC